MRILIHWLPILGYPMIASGLAVVEYLCLTALMFHSFQMRWNHESLMTVLIFQLLYWIYSFYVIYYIMVDPQIPRDIMMHVPLSNVTIIQNIITISLVCSFVVLYQQYANLDMLLRISTLFLVVMLIIHDLSGNMSVYMLQAAKITEKHDLIKAFRMLDEISLAQYASEAFLLNLWLKDRWTKNLILNKILFWSIATLTFINVIVIAQRGPLLFLFVTVLFYLFCKGFFGIKTFLFILIVSCFAFLFSQELMSFLSEFYVFKRFFSVVEDGGTGRFGSADSEFSLAWRQISDGPFLGSYFRTLLGSRVGNYPHNFILELLMTFGVVFTIPFMILLWYGIKNCMYAIRNNMNIAAFGLIFIYFFLLRLTSGTLFLDTEAWVAMAMMLYINQDGSGEESEDMEEEQSDEEIDSYEG
ncbi:MAG: hypothetical protein J5545_00670 [Bacteroidaceae bacterium]|nr:hypothetical protein [Bacteroidaceae bacterium]